MTKALGNLPLHHGGNLAAASKATGISIENWLDLSTGISPYAYPVHTIPTAIFSRLPYLDEEFKTQAAHYYGSKQFIAISGTQTAIQQLPKFLKSLPVLLPSIGYQEHHKAWQKLGNPISHYDALNEDSALKEIERQLSTQPQQHLVIINPNNPSTLCFSPERLKRWAQMLGDGAYLIVDEAFIDSCPEKSMIAQLSQIPDKIIILRSFGKFFGLAGLRLGFIFADDQVLKHFQAETPLWSINGPALYLAKKAFSDTAWQSKQFENLIKSESATHELFKHLPYKRCLHQRLFSSYIFKNELALTIFNRFYNNGVLLRMIKLSDEYSILRIGRICYQDAHSKNKILDILNTLNI